jgi:hypothetical protein
MAWIQGLPDDADIGIDEGGLQLLAVGENGVEQSYEIGGVPDDFEHPEEIDGVEALPEWDVDWTKTYIRSGTERVRASTEKEAEEIVRDCIGDLVGDIDYDGLQDTVEARPAV